MNFLFPVFLQQVMHAKYLHCNYDGCTCKCCEIDVTVALDCAFCGHSANLHTIIPLPPWHQDQMDTYNNTQGHIELVDNRNDYYDPFAAPDDKTSEECSSVTFDNRITVLVCYRCLSIPCNFIIQ